MPEPSPKLPPEHPPPSGSPRPSRTPSFSRHGRRIGRPPNSERHPVPIPEDSHGLGGTSVKAVIGIVLDKHWEDCQEEMAKIKDENRRLRAIIETRQYLDKSWHLPTNEPLRREWGPDVAKEPLDVADRPL